MITRPTTLEEIGRTIKRVRKAQGMKQVELAGYANVGVRFVIELESGKPTIQMGKAIKVLETLGCRILVVPPPASPRGNQP
jgi:y4mF family transcriptional regulator